MFLTLMLRHQLQLIVITRIGIELYGAKLY